MPIPYSKPALTFQAQLQQLKNRGLVIEDEAKALFLLENISYYRLSGYWYPMLAQPKSSHLFKSLSSFNQAFSLYCFDRELRQLVNAELEKIEVAIRAKMIYVMSHQFGPFWFMSPVLFKKGSRLTETLSKLTKEFGRSQDDFIIAFKAKYANPLPPSWILFEISSFGALSNIYDNLKGRRAKREIAQYFGLDDTTFSSWVHAIVYIRNICAHHSRFWNRKLSIQPIIPLTPINQWLAETTTTNTITGVSSNINNKAYYILSMIIYLLNTVNPNHKFKDRVFALFAKYSNVDPVALGFTPDWKNEPLWSI